VEGYRFQARQMAILNGVGRFAQKVDLPLEGDSTGVLVGTGDQVVEVDGDKDDGDGGDSDAF